MPKLVSQKMARQWPERVENMRSVLSSSPEALRMSYGSFFGNDSLGLCDVEAHFETMAQAIEEPDEFYDAWTAGQKAQVPSAISQVAHCAVNIPLHYPARKPDAEQRTAIAALQRRYGLDLEIEINPNDHKYEFCDPRWWPLLLEKAEEAAGRWPKGLAPYIRHSSASPFVYEAIPQNEPVRVGLLADFGTGSYTSLHIAKQLEYWKYPYAFHLGDVYYGGTREEFRRNYEEPLDSVMEETVLFSMPENHELYGEGEAYQEFLIREHARGRIVQEGSYFCLRFASHQIIGIDVNWNGRKRFEDEKSRAWLSEVLESGGERTTILLTGSAPFVYGDDQPSKLYEDLLQWHSRGAFALWFWGDNHYCGLFEQNNSNAAFVGSCIGHGGYPGSRQSLGKPSFAPLQWLETLGRFPNGMREDMTNNGWCEMTLRDDGGVDLTYVDWLSAVRCIAQYDRVWNGQWTQLQLAELRQEEFEDRKTLHR